MGESINECTIRGFKKVYDEELDFRRSRGGVTSPIKELHTCLKGRPVILGEKLDLMVQHYILAIRERGGTISTSVVVSAARGIVTSVQKTLLIEFGGPVELKKTWARSLLIRMNFTI